MTQERQRLVQTIFEKALEHKAEERSAFMASETGNDTLLRAEVEALVEAREHEESLLDATRNLAVNDGHDAAAAASWLARICPSCRTRFGTLDRVCPLDGEVLVEDPEAIVGTTIDGLFKVERLLGKGGMGAVYLARHALLRDWVAIKVLPHALGSNPKFLKRFFREGQAARSIHHPNAVVVHDLRTTSEGMAYMVMEYVEGRTLRAEKARRGPMTLHEALDLLAPVASALDEAHAHGVVHRDVKPENIMLGSVRGKPAIKLMDLGLASLAGFADNNMSQPSVLTGDGHILGTPYYMSPEQWGVWIDGGSGIDARTDVYSFAVVIFELVAGRRPFEGSTHDEIRKAHVLNPVPRLDEWVSDIPAEAGEAIARAMSKDRADRQASCGQLVEDIRRALPESSSPRPEEISHEPSVSTLILKDSTPAPVSTLSQTALTVPEANPGDPAPRKSARIGLAVAAVLVLSIGGWGAVRMWSTAEPAPTVSIQPQPEPVQRSFTYTVTTQKYVNGRAYKEPLDVAGGFPFTKEDKIWITVTAANAGCLYAIAEASTFDKTTGQPILRVLFPDPSIRNGSPRVEAGAAVRIPPEGIPPIDFDDTRGTEKLWLVWSEEPIAPLAGLADLLNERDQGRITKPETLNALRDLLAGPQAMSTTNETKKTTVLGDTPILVTLRELEHY